jgi:hypothetical protein
VLPTLLRPLPPPVELLLIRPAGRWLRRLRWLVLTPLTPLAPLAPLALRALLAPMAPLALRALLAPLALLVLLPPPPAAGLLVFRPAGGVRPLAPSLAPSLLLLLVVCPIALACAPA